VVSHPPTEDDTDDFVGVEITRSSSDPIFVQVANAFRRNIASGRWPAHLKLLPEPQLAARIGINRGTLRKALAMLADEGLLIPTKGRGTFVTAGAIEPAIAQRMSSLSEDLRGQGYRFRVEVLATRVGRLPMAVQAILNARPSSPGLHLIRVFHGDEGPLAYLTNYVLAEECPGIEDLDFGATPLFDALEQRYGIAITQGRRTFSAEPARGDCAAALGVPQETPVLYMEQVSYAQDGHAVEYSEVWINSSRVKITSLLDRRATH
jgi:GntR family transcriptional regulator